MPLQDRFKKKEASGSPPPPSQNVTRLSQKPASRDLYAGLETATKAPFKPVVWTWDFEGEPRVLSVKPVVDGHNISDTVWELKKNLDPYSPPIWSLHGADVEMIYSLLIQEDSAPVPKAVIPESLRPGQAGQSHTGMPAMSSSQMHAPAPPPAPGLAPMPGLPAMPGLIPAPAPLPPPAPEEFLPLGPGSLFCDKYEIECELGKGGMGLVYKAVHKHIGRNVAIKLLHAQYLSDKVNQQRFMQEAKSASTLQHPNVIFIYDFGFSPRGEPYIVMDYAEGPTLQDILKAYRSLDLRSFIIIVAQCCNALAHAHSKGLIHRDVKPSNIKLCTNEYGELNAKILDFGLAKAVSREEGEQQMTQSRDIVGSPLYMSPEQCNGSTLDARSDIYSLGCVMYESLTGMPPFYGKTMWETIIKHMQEDPPYFSLMRPDLAIPPEAERIVRKALAKDVNTRYQTIRDLMVDLHQLSKLNLSITQVSPDLPDLPELDVEQVVTHQAVGNVTMADLLKESGIISKDQLASAQSIRRQSGGDLSSIMIAQGMVERFLVDAAIKSAELIRRGHLSPPRAIVALSYCQRSRLSFETATRELGWALPALT